MSRFWRPGNHPKTWNSGLKLFSHPLCHINSISIKKHFKKIYKNFWILHGNTFKVAEVLGTKLIKIRWNDWKTGFFYSQNFIFWSAYPTNVIPDRRKLLLVHYWKKENQIFLNNWKVHLLVSSIKEFLDIH